MKLIHADCRDALKVLHDGSIDAIVTDPPYGLEFMGNEWDKFGATNEEETDPSHPFRDGTKRIRYGYGGMSGFQAYMTPIFVECLRVLKPGGHLLAFGGSRTYHRLASAIEDAGFEIRDQIMWLYGSGFPKSLDVSKAIDKAAGVPRREVIGIKKNTYDGANRDPSKHSNPAAQSNIGKWGLTQTPHGLPLTAPATDEARKWQGWGTALKPAHEPIVLARKPLAGTVAQNVLAHRTGAIHVDACRVETNPEVDDPRLGGNGTWKTDKMAQNVYEGGYAGETVGSSPLGRWPANVIHDGSEEVIAHFPHTKSGKPGIMRKGTNDGPVYGAESRPPGTPMTGFGDEGSAARFFYCAKANRKDRGEDNNHPTVKPTELMRYLVRLVTPPGGTVLDPFMGSGSTGKACLLEGFDFIGIEKEEAYYEIAVRRLEEASA